MNEIIMFYAEMFWSSTRYHENRDQCKIWPIVIIFAHWWFSRVLISARLLERYYRFQKILILR